MSRLFLAVALFFLAVQLAAADTEFLVPQKAVTINPLDSSHPDGESHAASHFKDALRNVRAAFVEGKPAPRAAILVDSEPDWTLRRKRDGGARKLLGATNSVMLSAQHLTPRVVSLSGEAREIQTKADSFSYRAQRAARSMFLGAGDATVARVALAKTNGNGR
jgi:hypothetical protein